MGLIHNNDAQFMLLAGFIISIGLVITTLMLNSIIFESNLAIDAGNDPSKNEVANLMEVTRDEMRNAYRNGTEVGNSTENKRDNFTRQMQSFGANISKIYAKHGEGVNVTWDISNWNDSIRANFTKNGMAGGVSNWTVVENVNNITVFALENVGTKGYFILNVTNSSGSIWIMNISSSQINVTNKTGGVSSYSPESIIYVFLNSTYEFNTSTSGESYTINFVNGNNAWGSYKIQGQRTEYDKAFTREHHYVLNTTVRLYTSRFRANITIPVTVPW